MAMEWVDERLRLQRDAQEEWPDEEVEYRLGGRVIEPPGPSPKSRKRYMRERFAAALPEVATSLLRGAKEGKLAELKVVLQMCDADERKTTPKTKRFGGRTFEEILMEGWGKEQGDGAGANGDETNGTDQDGRGSGMPGDDDRDSSGVACNAGDGGGDSRGCGTS